MTAERVEMIRQRLTEALQPETLDIEDDSASHAGHASAGGGGHFNVIIVSDRFNGLNLIKRHRMVYDAVADIMNTEIHDLSMKTYTPDEF
jgi:BolA protein